MNIGTIMTHGVQTCSLDDSLNRVAQLMWEHDCGCIPVVGEEGKVIGMITDRDICMAGYTQGQPLVDMSVASAASQNVVTVRENESLDAAEALMQKHQIRRIPVVDVNAKPIGIVSMNDLARHVHEKGNRHHDGLSPESIVRTLAAVSQPTATHSHAAQ